MSYSPENNPYIPGDPYSYDLKWLVRKLKEVEGSVPSRTSQLINDSGYISSIKDLVVPIRNRCDNSAPKVPPTTDDSDNWTIGSSANLISYDLFAEDDLANTLMDFQASNPHTLQLHKEVIYDGSYNGGADFSGINDGDTLIVSAELLSTAPFEFSAGFVLIDEDGTHNFKANTIYRGKTDIWKRLTVSAVVPDGWAERLSGANIDRLNFTLLLTFKEADQFIDVRRIFFGLGNVAVDWTPSPTDIFTSDPS